MGLGQKEESPAGLEPAKNISAPLRLVLQCSPSPGTSWEGTG